MVDHTGEALLHGEREVAHSRRGCFLCALRQRYTLSFKDKVGRVTSESGFDGAELPARTNSGERCSKVSVFGDSIVTSYLRPTAALKCTIVLPLLHRQDQQADVLSGVMAQ